MKRTRLKTRVLSVLLVLALICGFAVPVSAAGSKSVHIEKVDGSVSNLLPEDRKADDTAKEEYAANDVVRVSIILEDKSTIAMGFSTANIADNSAAMAYRAKLEDKQSAMETAISKAIGEKLDVAWNLTLAANLISANVKYGQIEAIEAVKGVKEVVIETQYAPAVVSKGELTDPDMAVSGEMTGAAAAHNVGLYGAGSRIAIIDTGLDTDHQSFNNDAFLHAIEEDMAEGKQVNLLGESEIAKVLTKLNAYKKNSSITAKDLHFNDKIGYGFNYVDNNLNIDHLHDTQEEHGSHVAGIAAANRYLKQGSEYVSAMDAVKVVGNAPDAQVLIMKVFGAAGGAYDSDYMVAIEDAVMLGADSVNLSLGSGNPGFSRNSTAAYAAILKDLEKSDTVVCMSAGNSYSWANSADTNGYLHSSDVSFQTDGTPGSFTNSLAVASVDNAGKIGAYFTVNGTDIVYTETSYKNAPMSTIAGEQEYVYIDGFGTTEELAKLGDVVKGKVFLCSRGSISFYVKGDNGAAAGAIATIIYNNQPGSINMDLSDYAHTAPVVSITAAEGAMMKAAGKEASTADGLTYYTGKMTISDKSTVQLDQSGYYTMSDFSSWGIPGSMEIKPEITAPGGSIYSLFGYNKKAGNTYAGGHDKYELMSGTSMASPQVAGLTALAMEYIRENKLDEKTGLTRRQLAQSLLMSTSVPLLDADGNYYSILEQGSGLASIDKLTQIDTYIMMADGANAGAADGKVKAELGDDPDRTGHYTFSFTVNNLGDQEQKYNLSADVFTQGFLKDKDGNYYLDLATTTLPANVQFKVNGKFINRNDDLENMDFDGDGDVDVDDGQALLDYLTEKRDSIENEEYADLNGDDEITTYDVHLFLNTVNTAMVSVPANGSVEVTAVIDLSAGLIEQLFELAPNGAYVEGFAYVTPDSTEEGVVPAEHSIPFLGFLGNWSDPSMYDEGSMASIAYEQQEKTPYMYSVHSYKYNVPIVTYPDGSYYFYGNPYLVDDALIEERNAINTSTAVTSYLISQIRNGWQQVVVSNAETGEIYKATEPKAASSAYYYVNGSAWRNSTASVSVGWKVTDANGKPLPEGTKVNVSVITAPEYYVDENGTFDAKELGKGAYLTTQFTVDDTAPVVKSATLDENKKLTVTAQDNQYIAYVALSDKTGTYLLFDDSDLSPNQTEKGAEISVDFDLSAVTDEQFTVVVADYASNETVYKVSLTGGGEPDPSTIVITLDQDSLDMMAGGTAQLTATEEPWEINDTIVWSSSNEAVATVSQKGVVTAVAKGECVITATSTVNPEKFATCSVKVSTIDAELNGIVWDEDGNVWWSKFNTNDLPNYTKLTSEPAPSNARLAAAAWNSKTGVLYGADIDTDNFASQLFTVDPKTMAATPVGTGDEVFFGDMAYLPHVDMLVGTYATYILDIDTTTGTQNGGWDWSKNGNYLVGVSYYGSVLNTYYNKYIDIVLLVDNTGTVYMEGFMPYNDSVVYFFGQDSSDALLAKLNYTADPYMNSTFFDGTYWYWTAFSEDNNKVDVFVGDFDGTGKIYKVGSFADGVWPVGGLIDLSNPAPTSSAPTILDKFSATAVQTESVFENKVEKVDLKAARKATGSLNAVSELNSVNRPDEPKDDTASVTVYADKPTTNAMILVQWLTNELAYEGTNTTTTLGSVNESLIADGKLAIGLADESEKAIGDALASIKFSFLDGVDSGLVSIAVIEENSDDILNNEILTLTKKCQGGENCPSKDLTDVTVGSYFHQDVDFVVSKGLMIGVESNLFGVAQEMNRAQMVTVLYRMAGSPKVTGDVPFTDVSADGYYRDAMIWAYQTGILKGTSETTFEPAAPVTRQQAVTFLYRFAKYFGADTAVDGDFLANFTDGNQVQAYAVEAMNWAISVGIINGYPDGTVKPHNAIIRAEAAIIIARYARHFGIVEG